VGGIGGRAWDMIGCQGGQGGQALATSILTPGGVFIEQGRGFGEEQAVGLRRPQAELLLHDQGAVGAVGEQHNRAVQLAMQGRQEWQARRPAQSQRGKFLTGAQVGENRLEAPGDDLDQVIQRHSLPRFHCSGSWPLPALR